MRNDWSKEEVVATVSTYLEMLKLELAGQRFVKREYNRSLVEKLKDRTLGAVEMKHGNISAVLIQLGCPYIKGYKPYGNFQKILLHEVSTQINSNADFHTIALEASERTTYSPKPSDFEGLKVERPKGDPKSTNQSNHIDEDIGVLRPKVDYLAIEQRNRSLGLAGEEFVFDYERWSLKRSGKEKLAKNVVHVALEEGDGAGYDVRSFDLDGNERYIEVKTTSYTELTPFWITRNEVRFAANNSQKFLISRVFNFRESPQFFELLGNVELHGEMRAETFRVSLYR